MRRTVLIALALAATACNPVSAAYDFLAARPPDTPSTSPATLTAPPVVDLDLPSDSTLQLVAAPLTTPSSTLLPTATPTLVSIAPPVAVAPIERASLSELSTTPSTSTPKAPAHRMRPGETLTGIAAAHHIPLKELLVANDYTWDDKPQVGAHIALTSESDARWTIRRRQTLSQIARTLGVTSAELAHMNGISDTDAIFAGQVLSLPTSR